MSKQQTTLLTQLIAVTGRLSDAILLAQIMYWHQGRLKVKRKGQLWLAKSREEMCAETGLTFDQYKNAISRLIQAGYVKSERGLFNNKITPHSQLTAAGWSLLCEIVPTATQWRTTDPLESTDTNQMAAGNASQTVEKSPNPITETTSETTAENTTSEPVLAPITVEAEIQVANLQDILKAHQEKKNTGVHGYGPAALTLLWKKRLSLSGSFCKTLTQTEVGQLRHLSKALGVQAPSVLDFMLSNWQAFASEVAVQAGVNNPPQMPAVWMVAKHYDVAVRMMEPKVQAKIVVPPKVQVAQSIAEEQKATPEDVQATLNQIMKLKGQK